MEHLLWSEKCRHCNCLVSRCSCVSSESLVFAPRRERSSCQHARAMAMQWRSTPEQISRHPDILVEFEHEIPGATQGLAQCMICLEHFSIGDLLKQLPCNHCFHSVCISKWLAERSSCPICQQCTNGAGPSPPIGRSFGGWLSK